MLRNFGILVGGETIEEAFWLAHNVMTGVSTQVCLSPTSLFMSDTLTRSFAHYKF